MNRLFPPAGYPSESVLFPMGRRSLEVSRLTGRSEVGFTLIELMVVVAIIAVLAGLSLGAMGYVNRKGAASRAQSEVAALSAAIDSYKLEFGRYPATTNLYNELTRTPPAVNSNKVFFEPPPGMVNTNSTPYVLQDPYGNAYTNYFTNNLKRNIGSFDLYCIPPDAKSEADWIHN